MSNQIQAFPLCWPPMFPRSKATGGDAFKTTLAGALNNVETSLRLFGKDSGKKIEQVVMSSNVTLGAHRPADAGVAVWFVWDSMQVCIPVDRYARVEGNLQAIHHIIEARRVELRHGGLTIVRATLTGFKALPAPKGKHWREILGLEPDAKRADAERAYKTLRSAFHPDHGGSDAQFDEVEKAWHRAQLELA